MDSRSPASTSPLPGIGVAPCKSLAIPELRIPHLHEKQSLRAPTSLWCCEMDGAVLAQLLRKQQTLARSRNWDRRARSR